MTSRPAPHAPPSIPSHAASAISRDHRWLADRAHNALRHPLRTGIVAAAVFLASLVVLVVYPRQQRRAAERVPELAARVDTGVLLARDAAVRAGLSVAEHTIDSVRTALAVLDSAEKVAATARSARHGVRAATRDSLTIRLAELSWLIERASSAPLLASFQALASARALAGDAQVRALADSLAEIERRRTASGALGGLDPVYVGLTAQAAANGRAIAVIAERQRAVLRSRLADAPALAGLDSLRTTLDTATVLAALDSLRRVAAATSRQLGVARATNARTMEAVTARERTNVATPPLAMLAATLALGVVLGILASLLREVASPRLSGDAEVERVLGVPALGTLRATDRDAALPGTAPREPRVADEAATRIARRLLSIGDAAPQVAVIGDDADVVASVVIALAASAAMDARAVLLIDTDSVHAPLLRRLRRRGSAGVTDVLTGGALWADTLIGHVGSHSLAIDLIPPGAPMSRAPMTASVERAGAALAQYAAGWDLVLVAVTSVDRPIMEIFLTHAGVRDAITCAQIGETKVVTLVAEHRNLQRRQVRHRGVVLTDGAVAHHVWRAMEQPLAATR